MNTDAWTPELVTWAIAEYEAREHWRRLALWRRVLLWPFKEAFIGFVAANHVDRIAGEDQ
jgi:hypothetical protein